MIQVFALPKVFATTTNEISLKDSICVRGDSNTKFYVYINVTGDVDDVKFPTWTELNGQDDLLANWSTSELASGEEGVWQIDGKLYNWRYLVDISQHNNEYDKYRVQGYAIKDDSRQYLGTVCSYNFSQTYTQTDSRYFLKLSAPQLKDSIVTRTQDNSYFDVYANIEGAVQKVQFPTWTSANGQDDLGVWPDGMAGNYSVNGKSYNYKCRIQLSDHNNEYGVYKIHIYAQDLDGNSIYLIGKTINFQEYAFQDATVVKESETKITRILNVRGLNAKRFYVYCYVEGNVEKVQFPTWTESNGQDDLLANWKASMDVRGENGNWQIYNEGETLTYNYRFQVDIAQHNNEYGIYHVHVYAYDSIGNSTHFTTQLNFLEDPNIDAEGILEETTTCNTAKEKTICEGNKITLYRKITDLRGIDSVSPILNLKNEKGEVIERYLLKGNLEIGEYKLNDEIFNYKYDFNISEFHLKEAAMFYMTMAMRNVAGNEGTGGLISKFTGDYLGTLSEEKVVFDRALIIKENTEGYYVYINVNSTEGNIKKIMYPAWTAQIGKTASGSYSSQDDILPNWELFEGGDSYGENGNWTINGNSYNNRFYVDRSLHNDEFGVYNTHIYAYDEFYNGNILCLSVNFQSNSIQGEHTDMIDGVSRTYDILYAWPTCVLYENGKVIVRESLGNAISRIPYGSQDKYEIVMEQDEELATAAVIPENKQVNLDLRGREIRLQYGGNSVLQVQGTLYLYDTVGNGEIEAVQPSDVARNIYAIQSSGNLYIGNKDGVLTRSLTITGTSNHTEAYGIYASKGTVTLGVKDDNILENLEIKGDTYGYWGASKQSTLNFYDGKITGSNGKSITMNLSNIDKIENYKIVRYHNENNTETAKLAKIEGIPCITSWKIPAYEENIERKNIVSLPIPRDEKNTYYVSWGDGIIDYYTIENFPSHTYENISEEVYTIEIIGKVKQFGYVGTEVPTRNNIYADYFDFTQYVIRIIAWGEIEAENYGFSMCQNLKGTIPEPTMNSFQNIKEMNQLFYYCYQLTDNIPENLFETAKNIKSFQKTFAYSGVIGMIPGKLFQDKEATSFQGTFAGCTGLTGGVIAINTELVTNMDQMFYGCSNLKILVLEKHFQKLTGKDMFYHCEKLESIIMLYEMKEDMTMDEMEALIIT